mmetsp:Transcript_28515/g.48444  ORF Transcript_28515/g.48444 Transcript_28515/m.48444 type:complete len:722 (+) Transcript_28515:233-2398(+)
MTTPTDKFGVGESSNKNTVAFNNELSHGDKAVEASHRNNRMGSRKHPNPMGTITIPARKRRWRKNASPQFPKGNGDVSSPFGGLLPKNYGGGTSPVARSPIGSPDRNIDISTFFSRSPPIQHQGRGGGGGGRLLDANLPSQGEQNNPMNFLTSAAADAKNQEYKTPITYEMGALRPNSEHGSSGSTMERKRMDTKRGGNVSGPSSAQTMGRVNQRLPRQQQPAYIQPQHRMQFDSTRQRIHDMPLKQRPPIGQKLAFRQPPRIVEMRYQQQNDSGGGGGGRITATSMPQADRRSQQQQQQQKNSILGYVRRHDGKVFYEGRLYVGPTTNNRPRYKSKQSWEWDLYPHGVSKLHGKLRIQIKQRGFNPSYPLYPNTMEGLLSAAMHRDKEIIKLWMSGVLIRSPKLNFDHGADLKARRQQARQRAQQAQQLQQQQQQTIINVRSMQNQQQQQVQQKRMMYHQIQQQQQHQHRIQQQQPGSMHGHRQGAGNGTLQQHLGQQPRHMRNLLNDTSSAYGNNNNIPTAPPAKDMNVFSMRKSPGGRLTPGGFSMNGVLSPGLGSARSPVLPGGLSSPLLASPMVNSPGNMFPAPMTGGCMGGLPSPPVGGKSPHIQVTDLPRSKTVPIIGKPPLKGVEGKLTNGVAAGPRRRRAEHPPKYSSALDSSPSSPLSLLSSISSISSYQQPQPSKRQRILASDSMCPKLGKAKGGMASQLQNKLVMKQHR